MTSSRMSNYRWGVCALLFFATTINYMDRQVIGLLKPTLTDSFKWTETDYANIIMVFTGAYAAGMFFFGRLIDKIGTKMGYTISIIVWSISAMAHALAGSTFGFGMARAALGLGESGNFPTAIKSVAEWFPKKERALAAGIFNSGSNLGAIIAPIAIPWILGMYGWQEAFIYTGALGFIWLIFWLIFYQIPAKKKKISQAEYDYIHSDAEEITDDTQEKTVSWGKLLTLRQTWAFIFGKFLTDPVWWFFLFWLHDYFHKVFSMDTNKPNWPLAIVYTASSVGSIGGGFLSSYLIKRGWKVYQARKISMLAFALCVMPILFTSFFSGNECATVIVFCCAAAAHQAWSANIFTTASDMFPKKMVSSVVGIGGMAGAVGGIFFPKLVGTLLDHFKALGHIEAGYNILFVICGLAYITAWLIMHFLVPRMKEVKL
ncbi:MFS transporter [Chitinophagaceae bacterium MMS25-I14]